MKIQFEFISGINMGFQYIPEENAAMINLIIFRILFDWIEETL